MQASHVILAVVAALCLVVVNEAFAIPASYMQYVPAEYRSYANAYMNGAGAGGIPGMPAGMGNYMSMIPGAGGAAGAGGMPGMPAGMGNYMSMIPGAGGAGGAGSMFGGGAAGGSMFGGFGGW